MSTTRHLINRRRRLATAQAPRPAPPPPRTDRPDGPDRLKGPVRAGRPGAGEHPGHPEHPEHPDGAVRTGRPGSGGGAEDASPPRSRPRPRLPAALGVLTVLLGGFAAWATGEAAALRDTSAARNTALTDIARTSELKGQVTKAVNELFSYDHAATATADRAIRAHLTGKAVGQHRAMLAPVRAQAARQKLVLTTTVTHSGVELIDGDRARVLVYADQSNTRTAASKPETTYGAAMFAVEAIRKDGAWRIAVIDTLGAGS
ncbi:nuclear transport factor 2 family protein [Streptomyces lavendofoliae]|uniref:Membrane protein n=1 Tax=Streptomyces lavendofoliae TaxID=67314 RepID=A0A918HUF6_9ACTN|nr:nuclear transport factor 2 family protein [Streptomyces lavendofoliae]GGU22984.1 membrane protein [Streptomyces lavendofoliae]